MIRKVRTNYSISMGRMAVMTHRIQLLDVLMTMIYYSERIPDTVNRGEKGVGKNPRRPSARFLGSFPSGAT